LSAGTIGQTRFKRYQIDKVYLLTPRGDDAQCAEGPHRNQ
jgi:hypothetical protein